MKIVLLLDLSLDLTLNRESNDERVLFSDRRSGVCVHGRERVLKRCYDLLGSLHFLLDRISEIPCQRFDFLYLLTKIYP